MATHNFTLTFFLWDKARHTKSSFHYFYTCKRFLPTFAIRFFDAWLGSVKLLKTEPDHHSICDIVYHHLMLFLQPCYNDLELNADWNKWEYSDIEIVQMIRMADMYPSPFLNDETPAVRGAESKNNNSCI